MRRFSSLFLCACLLSSLFVGVGGIQSSAAEVKYGVEELITKTANEESYDYFLLNTAYDAKGENIVLSAEEAAVTENGLEWKVQNGFSSRYYIKLKYRILKDVMSDCECSLLINGNLQYDVLNGFVLPKEYKNQNEPELDIYGNEITPKQVLSESETENYIFDYTGVYAKPLSVNIEENENTVCLQYKKDEVEILKVTLVPAFNTKEYKEYINKYKQAENYNGKNITVQGEDADIKSDTVLYPISDKSSPMVEPVETGKIILNTIGGNNWKTANQYIKWNIKTEESGFYSLNIKYKQNRNVGQRVRRALYINGEIPFSEASSLTFEYSSKWQMFTLGEEESKYLVYLEKGENEIKLQATLGEADAAIRVVDNCVTELNAIYRKLLVVLGSEPDMSKDYKLDSKMPETIKYMTELALRLDSAAYLYEELNGGNNSAVATLETLSRQLKKMNDDSDQIPSEFSYFKTNIGSLGTCQASLKQQPLEVDYFILGSENPDLPKYRGNIFENFFFGFKEFLCSFVIDYKNIGSLEKESGDSVTIKAWITSGRDQAQIYRSLISEDFTPKTGNRVKLELVTAASLLPATVAGIGPDVAIGVASNSVIDYSMRNAAYNLKDFDDFESFSQNFYKASFIPLEYMEGVYAVPTSIAFNVLYYRTDILEDLGLAIPDTWEDVVAMSSILSVNNMSFGLPSGNQTFLMMLKQNGLNIYNDDNTVCLLDNAKAIDVFQFYTNFYNNYGFPVTYSLVNRFRTGETPIAVDSIAIYNSLEISAPEIKGHWDFTVVPGFEDESGAINNTSLVSGTATMLLKNSAYPKESWEFIKWISSADAQIAYGREIESKLGSSGRYTSANKEALQQSCWNSKELEKITKQLESVSAIEQVPGGYYLSRNLDNAFRNAVYYDKKPMDVMFDYVYKINGELTDKRKELGLNTADVKS